MRLARVGAPGFERPIAIDSDGVLRSLDQHIGDITPEVLSPDRLNRLKEIDLSALPVVNAGLRYGTPVTGTRKFVAIGLNYRDHAVEAGLPIPDEPVVFMKAVTSISGPNDDIPLPRGSVKIDWEVELGVVIGSTCRYVEPLDAFDKIAGYVIVNDVSDRVAQLERGGTWDKGKSHDGFGPIGPWFVTADELGEADNLEMALDVCGQLRQRGNTSRMIFKVPAIVSYVSQFMTLEPGDIIATGTPPGVGMGMRPPVFLEVGDEVRLTIARLGEQCQRIVCPS